MKKQEQRELKRAEDHKKDEKKRNEPKRLLMKRIDGPKKLPARARTPEIPGGGYFPKDLHKKGCNNDDSK